MLVFKAPIILLYGTSTAGKTSICQEMKVLLPTIEVDGLDLAGDELIVEIFNEMFPKEIGVLLKYMTMRDILSAIPSKELRLGKLASEHVFSLREIAKLKSALSLKLSNKISDFEIKKIADAMTVLVQNEDKIRQKIPSRIVMHQKMFAHAVQRSAKGVTTILDLVPIEESDSLVEDFRDYLKQEKHDCPNLVVIVHCPLKALAQRMHKRSEEARMLGDDYDVREGMEPFEQYVRIFKAGSFATSFSEKLGELHRRDFSAVIDGFVPKSSKKQEAKSLFSKFGFPVARDVVDVVPACNYDIVVNTAIASPKEMAIEILSMPQIKKSQEARCSAVKKPGR